MEYYIDKRVFVNGKKSIIHMDNPFNLTQYLLSLIYSTTITCADNGLHLENILSTNGTQLTCVHLGGTLIEDTTISGDFEFTEINPVTYLGYKNGDIGNSFDGTWLFGGDYTAINNKFALVGVFKNGTEYDILLSKENRVIDNTRALSLNVSNVFIKSEYGSADYSRTVWGVSSIFNELIFSGFNSPTSYTELREASFRIGSTGGLPSFPAVTDYYDMPLKDGTANQKLVTDGAGTAYWDDDRYVMTFTLGDWTGSDLTIPVATHGRGTSPVVQVKNDQDHVVQPGNTLGIVATVLDKIRIPSNGDVTLSHGTDGPFEGTITII
jgi:hypothetical protein